MGLFQKSVVKKYLNRVDETICSEAFQRFANYFHNSETQVNIKAANEIQFQQKFLIELFVRVLGYTMYPDPQYDLTTEFNNEKGSKKADGAILTDGQATGVIELKGTETKNLDKINEQAFSYKNNQSNCIYVITSNFEKLRFYVHNAVEHEEFNLFKLTESEFKLLFLCLHKDNLLADIPEKIKEESLLEEERVTKRLYTDYSAFKRELWEDLVKQNPVYDELLLFKKSQKLLDRFLFIFFSEDKGLLPPNSVSIIIKDWEKLKELDEYRPLYDRFKKYFNYMNNGFKGKKYEIHAYNGGLFRDDEVLETIVIDDEVLRKHTIKLTEYDFESDVDTNILGHIFEHSLSEIENLRAQLEGIAVDKSKTKKKKEGVFYTPKYITKYIVDNTLGKLCEEKKEVFGITKERFTEAGRRTKKGIKDLGDYRDWLLKLKICDPACGSGAFLNQALEFLINEHTWLDELIAEYHGSSIVFPNVERHILENNLYGVDINEESIEIAKLSLWLRTAKQGRKLTTLSNNLKCGNSLTDDPEVAGKKAFNWQIEFPQIFAVGGFDVVIGNPPYGILIDKKTQNYYDEHFPLTSYKTNLYVLFIERMLQIFDKGIVHFIIPKSLLFNSYYEGIRKHLIEQTEINEIFTITEKVFEDAEVGSSLLIQFTIKDKPNVNNVVKLASAETIESFVTLVGITENKVPQSTFLDVPNCEISIVSADSQGVLNKLYKFKPIRNYYTLKNGLNPGNIKHILISENKESGKHKPIIWGKEISRYIIQWGGDYVNYDENIDEGITLDDVKSKKGMTKQSRIDFALRTPDLFEKKKIVVRKTGDSLIACLDENNYYFDTLVHGIYAKNYEFSEEYLLAILNSKPATVFYRLLHDIQGKVFAKISLDNLASFPIPKATPNLRKQLAENVKVILTNTNELTKVSLKFQKLLISDFGAEKISKKLKAWYELDWNEFNQELKKHKVKLSLAMKSEWMDYFEEQKQKAQGLKSKIERIDKKIDQMVYELYGLIEQEIKIVEQE